METSKFKRDLTGYIKSLAQAIKAEYDSVQDSRNDYDRGVSWGLTMAYEMMYSRMALIEEGLSNEELLKLGIVADIKDMKVIE